METIDKFAVLVKLGTFGFDEEKNKFTYEPENRKLFNGLRRGYHLISNSGLGIINYAFSRLKEAGEDE